MKNPYCAVRAVIVKDGKILVVKQKIGDFTVWDFPGGKIKSGEDPYTALKREVLEEVGLEVNVDRVLPPCWYFRMIDGEQVVNHVFLCTVTGGEVVLMVDSKEVLTEYSWVEKENILSGEIVLSHDSFIESVRGV